MLHALMAAADRKADALEDLGNALARHARRYAVEARCVGEILLRRHLLEEGGLHRDAVHEPLHRPRLLDDVVAEDLGAAAVRKQQRRENADQRRLARAVLPQDRDALAALDRKRDAFERRYAAAALAHARPRRIAAEELLAQVVDFNGEHWKLLRLGGTRVHTAHLPTQAAHGT
jgi:hypothetical protein